MTEDMFIKDTTDFITMLNNLFNHDIVPKYDNFCEYSCCYDSVNNLIIFNYNLIKENREIDLKYLGQDYLKYFILHEYGHIRYNNGVESSISNMRENTNNFINSYNNWIKTLPLDINIENYWAKQFFATTEFMADYFVVQNIIKFFPNLNEKAYILWRSLLVLNHYNECNNLDILHIDSLRYYHIPQAITSESINLKNDPIQNLIDISLKYSEQSLLLLYNQGNNFDLYNDTNFDQKIIKIMNEI